jgi:hypothetical protein
MLAAQIKDALVKAAGAAPLPLAKDCVRFENETARFARATFTAGQALLAATKTPQISLNISVASFMCESPSEAQLWVLVGDTTAGHLSSKKPEEATSCSHLL